MVMMVLKDEKENGKRKHDRGGKLVFHLCRAVALKARAYIRINCSASCQVWTYLLCRTQNKKTPWLQCNHADWKSSMAQRKRPSFCLRVGLIKAIEQNQKVNNIWHSQSQTALLCLVIFMNSSSEDKSTPERSNIREREDASPAIRI